MQSIEQGILVVVREHARVFGCPCLCASLCVPVYERRRICAAAKTHGSDITTGYRCYSL